MSNIFVSIVSHGQAELLSTLLEDLAAVPEIGNILVTLNKPETLSTPPALNGRLVIATNLHPRGFSSNHNSAFAQCDSEFFLVLNPDVRVPNPEVFGALIDAIDATLAGLIAPVSVSLHGRVEDSARNFPTLVSLVKKLFRVPEKNVLAGRLRPTEVPWVGGMFMLFRSKVFQSIGGFDEEYYLYYEDVDICARLWRSGFPVVACPNVRVIHDAQRTSHRSARYLKWHIASLLRYLSKHSGRLPRIPNNDASTAP